MGHRLTFRNISKVAIKRQVEKKADTQCLVYGLPRCGKTTFGFDLLLPYLKLSRKRYRAGKSTWCPPFRWSQIFKQFFATDCGDMLNKIKYNPDGSFNFVDEGIDILSWMHQLESEQKDLIEMLQKVGKKKMLGITISPSWKLLSKPVLARCHYLFLIATEPSRNHNFAFVFRNYENPILAEHFPFGFKKIIKDILKNPRLGEKEQFEAYIRQSDRFVGKIKFGRIDDKLYNLYDTLIKTPSIEKERERRQTVPFYRYKKLEYMFDTMMHNLHKKGTSVAQITNLLIDKFSTRLASRSLINSHLNKISALEVKPDLSSTPILKPPKSVDFEDLDLEKTLKTLTN